MREFDIGIKCDYLLTMKDSGAGVLRNQFIGVNKSTIEVVETWNNQNATNLIDLKDHVVMPGLINGHTHLANCMVRGLADDLPFQDWLFKNIFPIEAGVVSPTFVKTAARFASAEVIRGGTTTVADMYYFAQSSAEALDEVGLRALVGENICDSYSSPSNKVRDGSDLKLFEKFYEKFKSHDRITPCIAPHAPYTCNDETLKHVVRVSEKNGVPILIHVAETIEEINQSLEEYDKSPVARLFDIGLMDQQAVFAHGVHLTDDDIAIIQKTKVSVINNPDSNMKLGVGAAPIPKLLKAGIVVGLGTDGPGSNNDLNMFREMDMAAKLQKFINSNNTAITAHDVLGMATINGARALGLEDKVGSIEAGKKADIIIVNLKAPHMQPLYDIASQLVYSSGGADVDTVICDGKILMRDKQLLTVSFEHELERIKPYIEKIKSIVSTV